MLKLIKRKTFKDGSAEYVWDADEDFFKFYKKQTKKRKIVDEEVSQFILTQLLKSLDNDEKVETKSKTTPKKVTKPKKKK